MTENLTARDCLNIGFCRSGIKDRCATLGLDYHKFVREGLPFAELEPFNDEQINRAIASARDRIAKEKS